MTGASRGIGLAATHGLVSEGVHVTGGALKSSAELDQLAGTGMVQVVEVDLAEPGRPTRLVAAAGTTRAALPVMVAAGKGKGGTHSADAVASGDQRAGQVPDRRHSPTIDHGSIRPSVSHLTEAAACR